MQLTVMRSLCKSRAAVKRLLPWVRTRMARVDDHVPAPACRWDPKKIMPALGIQPIGHIRTCFPRRNGCPRQVILARHFQKGCINSASAHAARRLLLICCQVPRMLELSTPTELALPSWVGMHKWMMTCALICFSAGFAIQGSVVPASRAKLDLIFGR